MNFRTPGSATSLPPTSPWGRSLLLSPPLSRLSFPMLPGRQTVPAFAVQGEDAEPRSTDGTQRRGCCRGNGVARTGQSPLPSHRESPPGSEREEQGFPQLTRPRCDSQRGESGQDQALSSHPGDLPQPVPPEVPARCPWGAFALPHTPYAPRRGASSPVRTYRWQPPTLDFGPGSPAKHGPGFQLPWGCQTPAGTPVLLPGPGPICRSSGLGSGGLTPGGGALQAPGSPSFPPPGAGRHLQRPAAAPAASARTGG